jgi:putative ABC transport system permease protein
MIRVSLRGLTARPLRTLLTALAIVLGVGMVTAAFTFTDTMGSAADSLSSASYDGTSAVVSGKTAFEVGDNDWTVQSPTIDAGMLEKVRAVPGVALAVGDITDLETKVIDRDGKPIGQGPYFGIGFDSKAPGAEKLTPFRIKEGRWAAGPNEVVVDQSLNEKNHYEVGDKIKVDGNGAASTFDVVGVAAFGSVKSLGTATAILFDLPTAQRVTGKAGAYDSILVSGAKGASNKQVQAALASSLGDQAQVQSASAHDRFTFSGLKQFIDIIQIVLLAFGGVAIFVGAFTIFNALSITVAQRTRELGLLRMVGASRRQVLGGVMFEALAIGVLASAVGLASGVLLAIGMTSLFAALGLELPSGDTVFALRTVLVAGGVGTVVTLVAGLIPAWRATRIAPVAALRDSVAGAHVGRFGRVVRAVTGVVGAPIQKVGGTAGVLARRNAMRLPGRTASTAAALTIGVALTTMVTVVATGLKDTTKGSLDRRIDAAFVLTSQDGFSPVDPVAAKAAAAVPGVKTVSAFRQDGGRVLGQTEVINGIDSASVSQVFAFDWVKGDDGVPATLGADGAIVDEGWATEHHMTVGKSFDVLAADGHKASLTVRGIEKSPVLDAMGLGPITMGSEGYAAMFTADRPFISMVAAPASAEKALEKALAPYPDTLVSTKKDFIADRTAGVDQLLAIFAVLLALAVIVSLLGIVNTLVLSTFERTRELGMLRAIGMSRRQVRRMVRGESIITALLGASVGIVIGLGLGYVATELLKDEGLTFVVPYAALVVFAIVAVAAGVAAAVLPARRASRLDVLGALAYE